MTNTTMGYIKELQAELGEMLGKLDEEEQKKIIQYVSKKVYESWQNGKEQGQAPKKQRNRD